MIAPVLLTKSSPIARLLPAKEPAPRPPEVKLEPLYEIFKLLAFHEKVAVRTSPSEGDEEGKRVASPTTLPPEIFWILKKGVAPVAKIAKKKLLLSAPNVNNLRLTLSTRKL